MAAKRGVHGLTFAQRSVRSFLISVASGLSTDLPALSFAQADLWTGRSAKEWNSLHHRVTLIPGGVVESPGLTHNASLKPHLSGLRSSVEWLHDRGLPVARLASLFGTNANHIRQLLYRARHAPFRLYAPSEDLKALLSRSTDDLRLRLKVRPEEDAVVLPGSRLDRILDIESKVEAITRETSSFQDGVRRLRQLLPYIGYPSEVRWLRLLARVHHQLAWFLGHSGMSTSAFGEAKIAINLSRVAYAEWQDPVDLRRLTETCLIASNACLLIGDSASAQKYLQIAKDASETIADPRGSEHFRQLGVAYFQLHQDEVARDCFERATVAMEQKFEAENQAHLLMTGKRHLSLLGPPNCDQAQEVLSAVERDYPAGSLQHVMALNSVVACGLLTGSPSLELHSQKLIAAVRPLALPFHHQWTRTELLALTPDLPPGIRSGWIRRALYENTSKDL